MKMPWSDKTGLARAAIILVTILVVSAALCGISYCLVTPSWDPTPIDFILLLTSVLELAVVACSLAGLLVVLVAWLYRRGKKETETENND